MKNILLLFCFVFLAEVATDIYVPILPMFAHIFNSNLEIIQLTMSLHLVGFALGQLFYGPFSDAYGRRKTLLIGLSVFITATLMCAFSTGIEMLIFFRFIQGFGACVAPVVGMSMIKDLYAERTENIKILSAMSMTVSLSPIIGPILGTIIAEYSGWTGSFYLLSIGGMVLFPLLYFYLNETRNPKVSSPIVKSGLFPFVSCIMINALSVACVWVFITSAPFILMELFQVPLLEYGYYQAFTVMAYMAGGLFTNRFIEKLGSKRMLLLGLAIFGAGSAALIGEWWLSGMSKLGFVGFVALMECGIGIFRPVVINKIMDVYPGRSGFSASILGTAEMLISAVAIGLLGLFNQGIVDVTVGILTVLTLSSVAIYVILLRVDPEDSVRILPNT